jgi:hypothetical protein
MSMLRDIQTELSAAAPDLPSVLRKCKILAARLGSEEFGRLVEFELIGYPEERPLPNYRHLECALYGTFMNSAWQANRQSLPVELIPVEHRESFRRIEFREGIAKVLALEKGARVNKNDLIRFFEGEVYPGLNCVGIWLEIQPGEFQQLISAVQTRVLDFVLKIEAENPAAGESALHTQPVPPDTVRSLVNNFYGPVGGVAQNSSDFSQNVTMGWDRQDAAKLIAGLAQHLNELNLDPHQTKQAEAQIATIEAQLADEESDPVIVRQAGRTLRNLTEGAIRSLLATAVQPTIWHVVQQRMARLFT